MIFRIICSKHLTIVKNKRYIQYLCKSWETDIIRDNIEKKYQKKSLIEHILHRPDSYVGSLSKSVRNMPVYDEIQRKIIEKEISYSPALYKIYDEIIVNALDNKQRDDSTSYIEINVERESNTISVRNDGSGIPVIKHKHEGLYVPSLIFGHLLTSSNYDDSEDKFTGGRNGFGAKLCNLFSKEFTVETSNTQFGYSFKQTWRDNMSVTTAPIISPAHHHDFTSVTFRPDLSQFGMISLEPDVISLFERRAMDVACCTRNLSVTFNGRLPPVTTFRDYVNLHQTDMIAHSVLNDHWEVAVGLSPHDTFVHTSFVNGVNTRLGGQHVTLLADRLVPRLMEALRGRLHDPSGLLKPHHVRNCLWLFVNCVVRNPTFESQAKESLTSLAREDCEGLQLDDGFVRAVVAGGLVARLETVIASRGQEMLLRASAGRRAPSTMVEKLDDAVFAGGKHSKDCILILTEGDSAKSFAMSGLSVLGKQYYGVYPLKGKLLNARDASPRRISENADFRNLVRILGLRYGASYDSAASLSSLRYGRVLLMADQDPDGAHIKGLLINYLHCHWPGLLSLGFLQQFVTPLLKASKEGGEVRAFYCQADFLRWQEGRHDLPRWRVKYYKGLGTSTSTEAKEYFADIDRHRISFTSAPSDDDKLKMAFEKRHSHQRKQWLLDWMEGGRRVPEGPRGKTMTLTEFVDEELVMYSSADNERSIPSLMDGLKTGQRKIIHTCLKRNLTKEVKVAQLAGSVAELSSYHHGEVTLHGTIIGLAQDFVGSNNVNLLKPVGQFGTRVFGGKDNASARYIFTQLSPLTRLIFHPKDDLILSYLTDNNNAIEPEWYAPIIPLILVNGCEGIGTGWRSLIPNFNPLEVINNVRRMLEDKEPIPMHPWYRNFTGRIEKVSPNQYASYGRIQRTGKHTLTITELPVHCWTQQYKVKVLKPLSEHSDGFIKKYEDHNTDTAVRIIVHMNAAMMRKAEMIGFEKLFKLKSFIATNEMVLFDELGRIKKYQTVEEILVNFFRVRLSIYDRRKAYIEKVLTAECQKLENQTRFIKENMDGTIQMQNACEAILISTLIGRGYASDPVKALRRHGQLAEGPVDLGYLINMPMRSLTAESALSLEKTGEGRREELTVLSRGSAKEMWLADLRDLEAGVRRLLPEVAPPK